MLKRIALNNAVGWVALFVAMGDTGLAAHSYLINSTKQIAPQVLRQLRGQRGPRGLPGPQGQAGVAGVAGVTATSGTETIIVRRAAGPFPEITPTGVKNAAPRGPQAEAIAPCPAGTHLTGGGYEAPTLDITVDTPQGQGWRVVAVSRSGGNAEGALLAYAVCAS